MKPFQRQKHLSPRDTHQAIHGTTATLASAIVRFRGLKITALSLWIGTINGSIFEIRQTSAILAGRQNYNQHWPAAGQNTILYILLL